LAVNRLDGRIREQFPDITRVFFDTASIAERRSGNSKNEAADATSRE
jgi:hypothetical protein